VARFPGAYRPVVPYRVLDTRSGIGSNQRLGPGRKISVRIAGVAGSGVPSMGSATPPSAVVLNVTATNASTPTYLTVYPGPYTSCPLGQNCFVEIPSPPVASNLNVVAGQTVPNLVEVAIGDDGTVSLFNAQGTVDVIFDIQGWVTRQGATNPAPGAGLFNPLGPARITDTRDGTGGHHAAGTVNGIVGVAGWFRDGSINTAGAQFTGLSPARILDTRTGTGGISGPVCGNQTIVVPVAGQGGVPAVPTAKAAVMNVPV